MRTWEFMLSFIPLGIVRKLLVPSDCILEVKPNKRDGLGKRVWLKPSPIHIPVCSIDKIVNSSSRGFQTTRELLNMVDFDVHIRLREVSLLLRNLWVRTK